MASSFDEIFSRPHHEFEWKENVTPLASARVVACVVVAYVLAAIWLKRSMRGRKIKSLWVIPSAHNAILCFWSLAMFIGTAVAMKKELIKRKGDADWMLCFDPRTYKSAKGSLFYWSYVYYLSKFYELLDTALLVLKGRPLTFLHVFHHALVLVMTYLWLSSVQSLQHVALLTNTAIHVVMYAYYFLTTLGFRPRWKALLTRAQIVQFVFSFACSVPFVRMHRASKRGCRGYDAWCFNAFFNAALLALFIQFSRRTYRTNNKDAAGGKKTRAGGATGDGGRGEWGAIAAAAAAPTASGSGSSARRRR